ncbi:hypothetical protein Tco_0954553 [Tanacetum coccineum]|uniref:Uncharacterized protein n=1 Tax=Tanacetum coccineum TaxID=301880 RepID=A0ABQ5E4Q1_9ASTR
MMASSMDHVTQSLPGSQSAPNVALRVCFTVSFTRLFSFEKSKVFHTFMTYNVVIVFRKDKVRGRGKIWDENETQLVYGNVRATGGVVEGFGDAIRNMEFQQNVETGGENLGDYHVSLSDDEGNDVEFKSKETQSASISNARRMARKAKETFIEDKAPKKKRTSGNNLGASLEGIDPKFLNICRRFYDR